ncbi:hypothetical protein GCM10010471_27040 [Leucobacter komagatae]
MLVKGWAGALWVAAPLWYVLCEAVAAAGFPGYNYATFFISDLGVPEPGQFDGRLLTSQISSVMNAGFIGAGLLFFLGTVAVASQLDRGAAKTSWLFAAVLHAVGIVFVGLVPGSQTNWDNGLMVVHVVGAIALIAGGNVAAILSGRALRPLGLPRWVLRSGQILGALGFVSALLLIGTLLVPAGVSERGAVYSFFAWQLLAGIGMLRAR